MRGLGSLKITVVSGRYQVSKPGSLNSSRVAGPLRIPPRGLSSWPSPSEARRTCRTAPASTPLPERLSPVMTRVCARFSWLGGLVTSTPLPHVKNRSWLGRLVTSTPSPSQRILPGKGGKPGPNICLHNYSRGYPTLASFARAGVFCGPDEPP